MIVIMQPQATKQQVDHVGDLIREMGLKDHVIYGTDLTVVAVIGDDRKKDKGALEQAPGVVIKHMIEEAASELLEEHSADKHRIDVS